jgi:putative FmdB family regulatory protein
MPTYEYECEKCGAIFEEFQSITADPLENCVKEGCGGKVHRLLSPGAGFIFKGSGFYLTDYRSDSYKKAAQAEKSAGSSSKSESKKDTKSAGSNSSSSSSAPSSS